MVRLDMITEQDDPQFDEDAYETWADAEYDRMKDDKALGF